MDTRFRLAAVLGAVVLAVAVGIVSYNIGVSHGQAIAAAAAGAPPTAVPPYYWYRPWGFGFFGPFLFLLFWFFAFRLLFWGSFRRRGWYSFGPDDTPTRFEEWHRRAHERMNAQPPA